MTRWTFDVSFTTHRPIRVDEKTHRVTFVGNFTRPAAETFAAQWVGSRPGVEMVTRTTII